MAAPEPPPRVPDPLVSRSRGPVSRLMLMAGVAGACLLGATAGAWVRPEGADLKARQAPRAAALPVPAAPEPRIRIVMDATALPPRPPMEVLPDWAAQAAPAPPPQAAPVIAKPKNVGKPKPPKIELAKAEKPKTADKKAGKAKAAKVVVAKAEKSKSAANPKAKPKAVVLAKAETPEKAAKATAERTRLAKTETSKKAGKPAKAEKVVLAEAKARPKAEKPKGKAREAGPPARPAPKPVQLAKAAPPKPAAKPSEPPPVQQARRPENPWAADERRLARAYRRAAEAGVPEWRLERQQARWLRARDAAAREAPWAVPDVYDARIAELDDLAGEAAMEWN